MRLSASLAVPLGLLWLATAAAQSETNTGPSRVDVQQARMVLDELSEQMRIAEAKLDAEALVRKRGIGRLQALLEATDNEVGLTAAAAQRESERQQQLSVQLADLGEARRVRGMDTGDLDELIAESQAAARQAEEELARLSRRRDQLLDRLDSLRNEHLTGLLRAAVSRPVRMSTTRSALDRLLDEELGDIEDAPDSAADPRLRGDG